MLNAQKYNLTGAVTSSLATHNGQQLHLHTMSLKKSERSKNKHLITGRRHHTANLCRIQAYITACGTQEIQ